MQNKPVYEFLGYKILKADIHREQDGAIEHFSLKANPGIYNEANQIYTMEVVFAFKYLNNSPSNLYFQAAFRINDFNWKASLDENQLTNTFFSVIFPYIRTTAEHLTDDVRGKLIIPIIDLRHVNLKMGITFKPQQSKMQN